MAKVTIDTKNGAQDQTNKDPVAKKLIFLKIEISWFRMAPINLRKLEIHYLFFEAILKVFMCQKTVCLKRREHCKNISD